MAVREGTFSTAFGIGGVRPNPVYPKPDDEQPFTYPVAQFDHDEGNAISSGFVYRGSSIPELSGKFVFTDMVTGRVFYIDTKNLVPGEPAEIRELRVEFLVRRETWQTPLAFQIHTLAGIEQD